MSCALGCGALAELWCLRSWSELPGNHINCVHRAHLMKGRGLPLSETTSSRRRKTRFRAVLRRQNPCSPLNNRHVVRKLILLYMEHYLNVSTSTDVSQNVERSIKTLTEYIQRRNVGRSRITFPRIDGWSTLALEGTFRSPLPRRACSGNSDQGHRCPVQSRFSRADMCCCYDSL